MSRQRRTIWSETEELEEAFDVHWCTSEVTCAPLLTSIPAAESTAVGRALSDGETEVSSDGVQRILFRMEGPDKVIAKPSLWARLWKTGVIIFAPLALSPLLTTVNTTVCSLHTYDEIQLIVVDQSLSLLIPSD